LISEPKTEFDILCRIICIADNFTAINLTFRSRFKYSRSCPYIHIPVMVDLWTWSGVSLHFDDDPLNSDPPWLKKSPRLWSQSDLGTAQTHELQRDVFGVRSWRYWQQFMSGKSLQTFAALNRIQTWQRTWSRWRLVRARNQVDLMCQILLIVTKCCECPGDGPNRCADRANGFYRRKVFCCATPSTFGNSSPWPFVHVWRWAKVRLLITSENIDFRITKLRNDLG
jgi:hypothetical protein